MIPPQILKRRRSSEEVLTLQREIKEREDKIRQIVKRKEAEERIRKEEEEFKKAKEMEIKRIKEMMKIKEREMTALMREKKNRDEQMKKLALQKTTEEKKVKDLENKIKLSRSSSKEEELLENLFMKEYDLLQQIESEPNEIKKALYKNNLKMVQKRLRKMVYKTN